MRMSLCMCVVICLVMLLSCRENDIVLVGRFCTVFAEVSYSVHVYIHVYNSGLLHHYHSKICLHFECVTSIPHIQPRFAHAYSA